MASDPDLQQLVTRLRRAAQRRSAEQESEEVQEERGEQVLEAGDEVQPEVSVTVDKDLLEPLAEKLESIQRTNRRMVEGLMQEREREMEGMEAVQQEPGGGPEGRGESEKARISLDADTEETEKRVYPWEDVSDDGAAEGNEVERRYPLIPENPDDDENVYAYADIHHDEETGETVYAVREPDISEDEKRILARVEESLKEKINVDFGEMKRDEARAHLREMIDRIIQGRRFDLSEETKEVIQYYAYRNFIGLGRIEPLMEDKYIEDISCDGVGIPVYVYHRDPDIGSIRTNIVFQEEEGLDAFVRKLAQRCGRSVSMAEPLVDGSLPDGSRVQATLGTDIARRGSNFTIRRFTEDPLTPLDIMEFGTLNAQILAYFWLSIENGKSILIAGPTAAGKTSLLNALSLFIPPGLKIVSIEDTPELRLPHENWVPEVARSGFGFSESGGSEVTMDDLLEESLRQRPDYIIVGEVRGEEAYILFQQMATGHPGMSTIHASSLDKVMDRLTTRPIDLPPSLISNLDIIAFIKRVRRQGDYVRRVDSVYELEGFDTEAGTPQVNRIFEWDAAHDVFENISESSILAEISEDRGIPPSKLQNELVRREQVISWMADEGLDDYREVGDVARKYNRDPERVLDRISSGEG